MKIYCYYENVLCLLFGAFLWKEVVFSCLSDSPGPLPFPGRSFFQQVQRLCVHAMIGPSHAACNIGHELRFRLDRYLVVGLPERSSTQNANERSKGEEEERKGIPFPAGAFAIFSVSAKASLPISLPPVPFLFLSLPLPFLSSSFPFDPSFAL